ncbi:hypothetical protein [Bifidobacterium leontopitheci]|uniref:SAF domain-containing protein n=1 Tax=Bifidobacterium leontopitheci TaxID=2650774 RepID=A0A6I1GF02_9BIFI|nr:hypothetical protein [Bifidobacterium leontopitheci]KAB7790213.1 hypothetical protein F7D09_1285 [Bifidobacterium leontopitheci]
MKRSMLISGALAVALVAALGVGAALTISNDKGNAGGNAAPHAATGAASKTAGTAAENTATTTGQTVEMTADYPGYGSPAKAVAAADLVVTGVPLGSRETILYPEIDFTSGTPETNPQYGLTWDDIDMDAMGVPITVTRVRVTRVIKGAVKVGDVIEVAQVGGTDVDGTVVRERNTVLLSEATAAASAAGRSAPSGFLLLLSDSGNGTYDAINPEEGVLAVDSAGAVSMLSESTRKSPVGATLAEYEAAAR